MGALKEHNGNGLPVEKGCCTNYQDLRNENRAELLDSRSIRGVTSEKPWPIFVLLFQFSGSYQKRNICNYSSGENSGSTKPETDDEPADKQVGSENREGSSHEELSTVSGIKVYVEVSLRSISWIKRLQQGRIICVIWNSES